MNLNLQFCYILENSRLSGHNSGTKCMGVYVCPSILSAFNWIALSNKDALTETEATDDGYSQSIRYQRFCAVR